jgi:hypothetical protein
MEISLAGYSSTGTVDRLIDLLKSPDLTGTTFSIRKIIAPKRGPIYTDDRTTKGKMVGAAFAAMLGLPEKISVTGPDRGTCGRLIVCLPVWAGSPPPAMMSFLKRESLRGIEVGAIIVPKEAEGNTSRKIEQLVQKKGGTWIGSTVVMEKEVMSGKIDAAHIDSIRELVGEKK